MNTRFLKRLGLLKKDRTYEVHLDCQQNLLSIRELVKSILLIESCDHEQKFSKPSKKETLSLPGNKAFRIIKNNGCFSILFLKGRLDENPFKWCRYLLLKPDT